MAINKNTYMSDTGTGGKKKPTKRDTAITDRDEYDSDVRNAYANRSTSSPANVNAQPSGTVPDAYNALQDAANYWETLAYNAANAPKDKDDTDDSGSGGGYGGGYYAPAASAPVTADWMQYASVPAAPTALPAAAFDYGSAPEYVSPYQAMIDEALNAYLNRPAFAYDPQTDPQYSAYRKQYAREGQRATADTLGQYAAMTGGVPSSWAVTAAQQAGDYYAAQMADKIPELYQAAYAMYNDEGNRMLSGLNALRNAESDSYDRYLTKLGQFNTDRNVQLSLDQLAYERAQAEQDAIRDRVGSYLSLGGSLSGLDPALITGSGLTAAELAAIENSYAQPVYYGGGGGGNDTAADDSLFAGMTPKQILDLYLKGDERINDSPLMRQYLYDNFGIDPTGGGTDYGTVDTPYFQNDTEAKNWLAEHGVARSSMADSRTDSGILDQRDWAHKKAVSPASAEAAYDYYEDYVTDKARYIAQKNGVKV